MNYSVKDLCVLKKGAAAQRSFSSPLRGCSIFVLQSGHVFEKT